VRRNVDNRRHTCRTIHLSNYGRSERMCNGYETRSWSFQLGRSECESNRVLLLSAQTIIAALEKI
jgi:hypothetical protein